MPNRNNTDRKKRKIFEDPETLTLINLWASDKIQKQFSSTTRHNLIYESLSRQLKECGYSSTASEIKSKILNMKTEYRSKKPKSGSSTPDWPYFCIMHKVLGQRDAGNDDLLDESLANEEAADSDANQSENLDEDDPPSLPASESTELQSKPTALRRLATPKLRKISRPPRRARSQEDKLIETLVATEQVFQRRLDAMHDLETRNQQRDDLVANSMSRFLNAFAVLAENSSAQGTQPFPMPLPTIDINRNTEDTAAVVNSKLTMKKCTPFVQNQVEVDATLSLQLTRSRKTKLTKRAPSPVLIEDLVEDEDTYDNSTAKYLDEMDMDFPPFIQSFEADVEENNESDLHDNGPIIDYLNNEADVNIPTIVDSIAAKNPRIVLHERIQPPLKITKKFEKMTPKSMDNCKSSTFTGFNSSMYKSVDRRPKPGNIIVCRADS